MSEIGVDQYRVDNNIKGAYSHLRVSVSEVRDIWSIDVNNIGNYDTPDDLLYSVRDEIEAVNSNGMYSISLDLNYIEKIASTNILQLQFSMKGSDPYSSQNKYISYTIYCRNSKEQLYFYNAFRNLV